MRLRNRSLAEPEEKEKKDNEEDRQEKKEKKGRKKKIATPVEKDGEPDTNEVDDPTIEPQEDPNVTPEDNLIVESTENQITKSTGEQDDVTMDEEPEAVLEEEPDVAMSDESEAEMIVEHAETTKQSPKKIDGPKQIKEFRNHRLPLTCICIDAKDKYAFTASKDGSIIKWCLKTRKILKRVNSIRKKEAESNKKLEERYHVNHINAIAISDDSKFLATGGWDKKVRIWSPKNLEWLHTFSLHRQEVTALAFRRGHHMLYSGSSDRSVMLWNLEDDDNLCFVESLIGHESPITSMDTTRKERVLTSGGRDQSIRIWKIVEQAQTVFQSKHQSVDVARFINDQLFVSGGEDGNITLWTTMKRSPLCSVKTNDSDKKSNLSYWVTALATFSMKQAKQKSSETNPNKRIKLADEDAMGGQSSGDDSEDEDKRGSDDENNIVALTDGESDNVIALIASGSCDSKLHIWKLIKNNLELHQSIECPGYINDLKFTSDGSRVVAACGKEHRFGRWTVAKGVKNSWRMFDVNKL